MKLMAFSVFDKVAGAYARPIFVPNAGIAVRVFGDSVGNPEAGMVGHESDFDLYKVGEFDDNKGLFESCVPTVLICRATDFMKKPEVLDGQRKGN